MSLTLPRPASTVVLLREADGGLEIFLVRRHDRVAFMGGAHVFPGGRVDQGDLLPDAPAWCDGIDVATARMPDLTPASALAFHVAAIRELFEEAGVLLARDQGDGIVSLQGDSAVRFERHRRQLAAHEITMADLLRQEHLRLALDALAFFAHWVTPEIEAARFDTRFFLAIAPEGQTPVHDDGETTDGVWMSPATAIERCRRGDIALPPPTWTTLRRLSKFSGVEEAWMWGRSCQVARVQPGFVEQADGTRLVTLPGDPLVAPLPGFEAEETRFLLKDGRWMVVDAG